MHRQPSVESADIPHGMHVQTAAAAEVKKFCQREQTWHSIGCVREVPAKSAGSPPVHDDLVDHRRRVAAGGGEGIDPALSACDGFGNRAGIGISQRKHIEETKTLHE